MRSKLGFRRGTVIRAAAAAAVVVLAASYFAPTADTRGGKHRRVYWGAWIGSQLTGTQPPWDMHAVAKFEGITGKRLSLVEFGSPFADCSSNPCAFYSFPTTPMSDVRAHGAIPFLSWSSAAIPGGVNQPDFQLSDVIRG